MEALKYHQKDLDIALQLGDKGGEEAAYGNIGKNREKLGNYQEALIYHQKHLDIALQLGSIKVVKTAATLVMPMFKSLGNLDENETKPLPPSIPSNIIKHLDSMGEPLSHHPWPSWGSEYLTKDIIRRP